jgi:hypothetical protein
MKGDMFPLLNSGTTIVVRPDLRALSALVSLSSCIVFRTRINLQSVRILNRSLSVCAQVCACGAAVASRSPPSHGEAHQSGTIASDYV